MTNYEWSVDGRPVLFFMLDGRRFFFADFMPDDASSGLLARGDAAMLAMIDWGNAPDGPLPDGWRVVETTAAAAAGYVAGHDSLM